MRSYFSLLCLHQETQMVFTHLPLVTSILGTFVHSQIQGHKEVPISNNTTLLMIILAVQHYLYLHCVNWVFSFLRWVMCGVNFIQNWRICLRTLLKPRLAPLLKHTPPEDRRPVLSLVLHNQSKTANMREIPSLFSTP